MQLTPDQFISKLYRATSQVPLAEFPEWALELLRRVMPFDGAVWATGHVSEESFQTQNSLDVEAQFFEDLQRYKTINPMYDALLATQGKPIDMADIIQDPAFYSSPVYAKCFKPYGIERILSSIHLDERSGIFTLLTLYRFDRDQPFSIQEKDIQQQLLYHLLSAASHRQFLALTSVDELQSNHGLSYALCNAKGAYHAVEPRFLDIMAQVFPNADSQLLPIKLNTNEKIITHQTLLFEITPIGELFRIAVRQKQPLDLLTDREKEVVLGISRGNTFKQVAKALHLSPSTVSNHLYRIYTKLGINSRSELVKLTQAYLEKSH